MYFKKQYKRYHVSESVLQQDICLDVLTACHYCTINLTEISSICCMKFVGINAECFKWTKVDFQTVSAVDFHLIQIKYFMVV